ncbi:MAG: PEP-CTERM sorting domain-containing protein [Deltaproteobacteria bacterium]|nr:PEP-CTERM sorting domain-containing protein [Deltaproteobacteria bacterium]
MLRVVTEHSAAVGAVAGAFLYLAPGYLSAPAPRTPDAPSGAIAQGALSGAPQPATEPGVSAGAGVPEAGRVTPGGQRAAKRALGPSRSRGQDATAYGSSRGWIPDGENRRQPVPALAHERWGGLGTGLGLDEGELLPACYADGRWGGLGTLLSSGGLALLPACYGDEPWGGIVGPLVAMEERARAPVHRSAAKLPPAERGLGGQTLPNQRPPEPSHAPEAPDVAARMAASPVGVPPAWGGDLPWLSIPTQDPVLWPEHGLPPPGAGDNSPEPPPPGEPVPEPGSLAILSAGLTALALFCRRTRC